MKICLSSLVFTQQSCCHGAVVRVLRFLENRCMHPVKMLWEPTRPPFLQAYFLFLFQNFQVSNVNDLCFVFLNMGPYESENFKRIFFPAFFSKSSQKLYEEYNV